MPKDKAIIKKIILDLGDKEIELTVEQAKKLTTALDEMFGEKIAYTYPRAPIIIERYPPYTFYWSYTSGNADPGPDLTPEVWCGNIGGTAIEMSFSNEILTVSL